MGRKTWLALMAGLLAAGWWLGTRGWQSRSQADPSTRPGTEAAQPAMPKGARATVPPGPLEPTDGSSAPRRTALRPLDPAAEALDRSARQKDSRYLEQLIQRALHDPSSGGRLRAVAELGFLRPAPDVTDACLAALKDEDSAVREQAASCLESLEDLSAVEVLQDLQQRDSSESVRTAAWDALRHLESVRASRRSRSP